MKIADASWIIIMTLVVALSNDVISRLFRVPVSISTEHILIYASIARLFTVVRSARA